MTTLILNPSPEALGYVGVLLLLLDHQAPQNKKMKIEKRIKISHLIRLSAIIVGMMDSSLTLGLRKSSQSLCTARYVPVLPTPALQWTRIAPEKTYQRLSLGVVPCSISLAFWRSEALKTRSSSILTSPFED